MQKRISRKKPCYWYLIVFISAIYHPFSNSSETVSWDKSFNPVGTANEFLCLCLQRGLIIVETFWCTLRTRKGNKRTSDPKDHLTLYPLDSIQKYVYRVHGRSQLIFFTANRYIHSATRLGFCLWHGLVFHWLWFRNLLFKSTNSADSSNYLAEINGWKYILTAASFPQVCNTWQGRKGRQHEQPWKEHRIAHRIAPQLLAWKPILSKAP